MFMFIYCSVKDYIPTDIVRCLQWLDHIPSYKNSFALLHTALISVSLGRLPEPACKLLQQSFMWVSSVLSGNLPVFTSHLFWETPVLSNRLIVFPPSHIVKIERRVRQHQAGLLNHSYFLAPLGWLKSSCQKRFIMSDVGSCN